MVSWNLNTMGFGCEKNTLIILLKRWLDWIPTFFWFGWEYRRCGVVCGHVMLVCPSLWCLRECLLGLAQWEAVCLFFSHVYPQITSTDSSWQGMHYIHFLWIWHCNQLPFHFFGVEGHHHGQSGLSTRRGLSKCLWLKACWNLQWSNEQKTGCLGEPCSFVGVAKKKHDKL